MQITNPRLASLAPAWAPFHGFTLLFDNPGAGLCEHGRWRRLTTDPNTGFYNALRAALAAIDSDTVAAEFGLCRLPHDTYHVTAWDGINDDNLPDVVPRSRAQAERFLTALPDTLATPAPFTRFAQERLCDWRQPLRLRFARLINWRDRAFGAQLAPAPASRADYAAFETRRAALNEAFRAEFGTQASAEYRPHVTLGYFANDEVAARSRALLAAWQAVFARELRGQELELMRVRLYGFTDLTLFVCA